MSSYQRLIVHRVAQYFKLHHTVADVEAGGQKRAIVLFKTPESRMYVQLILLSSLSFMHSGETIKTTCYFTNLFFSSSWSPVLRFLDLLEQPDAPAQQVKIMKRPDLNAKKDRHGNNSPNSLRHKVKAITIEEREEAYARARARIFNQDSTGDYIFLPSFPFMHYLSHPF